VAPDPAIPVYVKMELPPMQTGDTTENVEVGVVLTTIALVVLFEQPREFVALIVIKYVPGKTKVWEGGLKAFTTGVPSPKFHCHELKEVVTVSVIFVKLTTIGAQPRKEVRLKSRVGAGITVI